MRKLLSLATFLLPLLAAPPAVADAYPWNNHAPPYTFLFGNDIDTHQQTRLGMDGSLSGYFYVHFTGLVTKDDFPVATHVDCSANPCTVGWTLEGKPRTAAFLYEVDGDHPVFLVDRLDIPQPGAHAHFHWLGGFPAQDADTAGYLLQLNAVEMFCFIHHDAARAKHGKTCRDNGGIAVSPGIDVATHLNIVTSFP